MAVSHIVNIHPLVRNNRESGKAQGTGESFLRFCPASKRKAEEKKKGNLGLRWAEPSWWICSRSTRNGNYGKERCIISSKCYLFPLPLSTA